MLLLLFVLIVITIGFCIRMKNYKKTSYYQITQQPYFSLVHDKGRYGEYLVYQQLKLMETFGAKFLFNVYLPKENGATTEIDVIMISPKGICVIESKNYSGWIFGTETQKNWCQTLPVGNGKSQKEFFYNPVMQNKAHITCLRRYVGEQIPIYSIIAFSDRCTLKSVHVKSTDVSVVNRRDIALAVSEIYEKSSDYPLHENDILKIYRELYPFSQSDELIRNQHIDTIESNKTVISTGNSDRQPDKNKAEPQANRCPRCNGNLVLRTARKGPNSGNQFYGCSNYPKCNYIQNVQQQ